MSKGLRRLFLLSVALGGLVVLYRFVPVVDWILKLVEWIRGLGVLGYAVFILTYIAVTVLAGPAWALTLAAGFAYGLLRGTALVSAGSTLGAAFAFVVGRRFARGAILKRAEGNPRFKSLDDAVGQRGFFIVFLTRLSPVFPFTWLNYIYGLTKVRFASYFFASWLGMLPVTMVYVYLGTLITKLSHIGSGAKPSSPYDRYFYFLGLAATAAGFLYIAKIARDALKKAAPCA